MCGLPIRIGKRFQRMVAPYASSCQCARTRVRSPDSCTQNLCIRHAKRNAASRHNQRRHRTGRRLLPECSRREEIRRCCRWDQRSDRPPSERVRFDPSNGQWKVHHQIACDGVHVGADSGFSETAKIVLSIPAETVIPLRREPPVDVITVSHLKSTSV